MCPTDVASVVCVEIEQVQILTRVAVRHLPPTLEILDCTESLEGNKSGVRQGRSPDPERPDLPRSPISQYRQSFTVNSDDLGNSDLSLCRRNQLDGLFDWRLGVHTELSSLRTG